MNKYEKAIQLCIDRAFGSKHWDLMRELVERATPKKVVYDETNDMDICCNCGGNVYHHQHTNNCGDCGQALDWGDEE